LHKIADVVDLCHRDDAELPQVGIENHWLGLIVADDADAQMTLEFMELRLEFRPEIGIFQVVNGPGKTSPMDNSHPTPHRTKVRVVICPIKKFFHTVLLRSDTEESAHIAPIPFDS